MKKPIKTGYMGRFKGFFIEKEITLKSRAEYKEGKSTPSSKIK